ncbi:MAG: DUF2157 domain-containing protein [Nostocaceae cyanobacterium]|nr:DUF2157 domain-containing protein [Nostocaceae cyanobacterium]
MIFDNFRRKLRQEAQLWREEGLIDATLYQQLAERYQFNHLETVARDRFVFILIGLGSILLGLGVITFVAANWQAWSKEVKLTLLLSLFLVTNIAGFSLWRQPVTVKYNTYNQKAARRRKNLLGHGLLIFGALLLGANLGLLSQMFHLSGESYELFLVWGLGVLTMAYSLRLTSLGIMSIILVIIGYFWGLGEYYSTVGEMTWARLVVQHMPLLAGVLFVPLAYLCKSRWLFGISAIASVISLQFNLQPLTSLAHNSTVPWLTTAAFVLPPALLWSYDDLIFPKVTDRLFQPLARNLALVHFSVLFYILSFRWLWETPSYNPSTPENIARLNWLPWIDVAILTSLALLQWLYLWRHFSNRRQRKLDLTTIVIGGFIIVTAAVTFVHQAISPLGVIAIFLCNVLLAMLACGLIREGLELGERRAFWGGMVLLTLQIISRMLEYNTALLFKSFVFVLCGVAVILAGLWFERYLSALGNREWELGTRE